MSLQWVADRKSGASLYITSRIGALLGSQNPVDNDPQDAKRLGGGLWGSGDNFLEIDDSIHIKCKVLFSF